MKFFTACFTLLLSFVFATAQQPDAEGSLVKWLSIEEALKKNETQPKPIILDFYTDWCGWCKHMMKTTYANPSLAQYINANFYPVKFNAEGKDTVYYLGQKYVPTSDAPRATHPLAAKLLQNKLMYPTTLFLNNYDKSKNEFSFSMVASGYLDEKKIEPILVFSLENAFRNSSYDDFNEQFQTAFFDSVNEQKLKDIKWSTAKESLYNAQPGNKKTMVLIGTDWCNTCRVMQRSTFTHDSVSQYIKDKYNLVAFNPELKDPITFQGQTFINQQSPQMPFHQLALALCRNNLTLPTLAILDENLNLIDAIPYYINPSFMKDITRYYGDNIYTTKSWSDFQQMKQ